MTLPADLPLYVSGVTMLAFVWKASSVSTQMSAALAEQRLQVSEVKTELAALKELTTRIALVEQRVGQLEETNEEIRRRHSELDKRIVSTDKARAVSEEQIRAFKEQSSPDLSRFVVPRPEPRKP